MLRSRYNRTPKEKVSTKRRAHQPFRPPVPKLQVLEALTNNDDNNRKESPDDPTTLQIRAPHATIHDEYKDTLKVPHEYVSACAEAELPMTSRSNPRRSTK
mmetsp:Transcript_58634/g.156112  ORF Transcript_58634/g.156112 Transcript_58634/m.156112 type:complete len:101 (+) Transcript_58634:82-384(+)